jgi:hypothetical protein
LNKNSGLLRKHLPFSYLLKISICSELSQIISYLQQFLAFGINIAVNITGVEYLDPSLGAKLFLIGGWIVAGFSRRRPNCRRINP